MRSFRSRLVLTSLLFGLSVPLLGADLEITVDATELHRKLLHGTVEFDVPRELTRAGGTLGLWYPKWIPGVHGPNGPVGNLAGLEVFAHHGPRLVWNRTPGEVYRIEVEVPAGVDRLRVETRYITNQPTTNSRGVDSFGADGIGVINLNTILFYREDQKAPATSADLTLLHPATMVPATALQPRPDSQGETGEEITTTRYQTVSLEELIDAPIVLGRHHRSLSLVTEEAPEGTPPHRLQLVSESKRGVELDPGVLESYRRMVTEASALFGSHPFPSMDILLGSTDLLRANGLEHSTSTFNVLAIEPLTEPNALSGWNQMLIPHEYVHTWCGKYRRPAGMITGDYHTPKDTELLWVYEGLAQYLGDLLEARTGMATLEEYRWSLLQTLRRARHRQGRSWRSLADTGAAAHILRGRSRNWGHLRRGQDYYSEGALLWMEIDARLRNLTDGARSLDDFVQRFFHYEPGMAHPNGHDRSEVIAILDDLASDDWAAFLTSRIDRPSESFQLGLLEELGYHLQFANEAAEAPEGTRVDRKGVDALDSIGLRVDGEGKILQVLLESPADRAGLGPEMQIAGVGDYVWSRSRFLDALNGTLANSEIELLLISGDRYERKRLQYEEGPRHLVLVRNDDRPDRLAEIATPRVVTPK